MKVLERNVMRLAVVQHLRATYNIKTKNWNKNKQNSKLSASQSVKVFGVPLEGLPHCPLLDYGSVPSFLVDACTYLMVHANTEGLFRKSGSIVRLKALRAKLDQGEDCLSSALPVDVAALLKQFFREMPEPVLSTELHASFLKAQELPTEEERTSATMLLSCVLPDRNLNTMRYFFSFLQSVSQRSAENKMDSSNLSVIFAPNLLHCAEGAEKMNAATEKKLKLQAAVVHCFIQNARDFGVVPQFLQEKVPAMLGCGAGLFSPPLDHVEENSANSGLRRSGRRSLGDLVNGALNKFLVNRTPTSTPKSEERVFSSATPVIMTPRTKRKLPMDSDQNRESSNKKRRSIKKNLGIELLPHVLFGAGSTPGSVHSACSPSVVSTGKTTRLAVSSARRKSKRLSYRTHQINRHESGKSGCFSPRVPKKDAARKSLRLRFSLGKGIKETTFGSQSLGVAKGSETIGWRLATQDSTTSFHVTKEPDSSPAVILRNKHACKVTKYISQSEDNLLSPQHGPEDYRSSWNGETPDGAPSYLHDSFSDTPMNVCLKNNYFSEPAIVSAKPPAVCSLPKALCCATSAESLDSACSIAEEGSSTGPTLLKINRAFRESGNALHAVVKDHSASCGREELGQQERSHHSEAQASVPKGSEETLKSEGCLGVLTPAYKCVVDEQNITFGQIEIVPLSPLHIDSALFEFGGWDSREQSRGSLDMSTCAVYGSRDTLDELDEAPEAVNCSQLIDALDIQSPVVFRLNSVGCQSTPHKAQQELHKAQQELFKEPSLVQWESCGGSKPGRDTVEPKSEAALAKPNKEGVVVKVADQIQRFNLLTLKSPQGKRVRSPLKFQRTPVRQSVRRINSLLENSRKPGAQSGSLAKPRPMLKTTSLDAGLSTVTQLKPFLADPSQEDAVITKVPSFSKTRPPVPPKRVSIRNPSRIPALGDVTNKVPQRANGDTPVAKRSETSEPPHKSLQQLVEKEVGHYRGSPRYPLNGGRLLSATKPIDL